MSEQLKRTKELPPINNHAKLNLGAEKLLFECGQLSAGERVVIICDETTRDIAIIIQDKARTITDDVSLVESPLLDMHGQEPFPEIRDRMMGCDLLLGLTAKSMAHSEARREASNRGARYLSLPDYSAELLMSPALQADYVDGSQKAAKVADRFTQGELVHVHTPAGTDIHLAIVDRAGNCCPGIVEKPGDLGSPPDIEANVSPVESKSNGIIVVDGSIPFPGLGLLQQPVTLKVQDGKIVDMDGPQDIIRKLEALFNTNDFEKTRILAECGVGLNPMAELTGVMLTDEGAYGTMHFGFGSNATVGGQNDVPFHLDFVFRNPTLLIDGECVISDGILSI